MTDTFVFKRKSNKTSQHYHAAMLNVETLFKKLIRVEKTKSKTEKGITNLFDDTQRLCTIQIKAYVCKEKGDRKMKIETSKTK